MLSHGIGWYRGKAFGHGSGIQCVHLFPVEGHGERAGSLEMIPSPGVCSLAIAYHVHVTNKHSGN